MIMKKNLICVLIVLILSVTQLSCNCNKMKDSEQMIYKITKADSSVILNGDWNCSPCQKANILELNNYMGDKPDHFPKTQVKLLYDDDNIYVFFKVEDQYIRAVADKTHGNVWQDSCVEFFFTPSEDMPKGYFNLETNCDGTLLMHYGGKMPERKPLDIADCEKIEIYHSLPKIVEPEISEPTTWVLQYKLPLEILNKYCSIDKPASGVKWRANFYKCADKTSHPHWLTWSPVDNPTPNFHLPQYFGIVEFE